MTGIIILAAGESRRLGQPKQNLIFREKTLLQRVVETALSTASTPVLVVLGAKADLIQPTLKNYQVTVIINSDWAEGMASSVRLGIAKMQATDGVDSALVMLCDQPFVSMSLIEQLQQKFSETNKPIVACQYKDTVGVPILFHKSIFPELLLLKGHEGAKNLVAAHAGEVATVPFDLGTIDIDTVEDYNKLLAGS